MISEIVYSEEVLMMCISLTAYYGTLLNTTFKLQLQTLCECTDVGITSYDPLDFTKSFVKKAMIKPHCTTHDLATSYDATMDNKSPANTMIAVPLIQSRLLVVSNK
jgi:hypothetical protein